MDDEGPADETAIACPECSSRVIKRDEVRGEVVCQDCGLVIEDDLIDPGPEWCASDPEQVAKRARTGPPRSMFAPGKGLSTEIGREDKTCKFQRSMTSTVREKFRFLRKLQNHPPMTSQERSRAKAIHHIKFIAGRLNLPPRSYYEADAIEYFEKARSKGMLIGRAIREFNAACMYATLREAPRSIAEISKASGVDAKRIKRVFRLLQRERVIPPSMPLLDPLIHLEKIYNKLGRVPADGVPKEASELWGRVRSDMRWQGLSSVPTTAALLYIASRVVEGAIPITNKELCAASDTSEVTIRKRRKLIESILATVE